MRLNVMLCVAGLSMATTSLAVAAPPAAGGRARRVVVAGPQEDGIASRVHKELTALGFEAIRVGALEGCARSAVIVAALDNDAIAAACSDGDQVGVWIADGSTLRLRDVVVAREDAELVPKQGSETANDRGRETTAIRAAEVTRATIALREAEEDAARENPPAPPPTTPLPVDREWAALDRDEVKPPPKAPERRTPMFTGSAGVSALMGVDATVGAVSGQVTVGVFEHLSIAARLELPFESRTLFTGTCCRSLDVSPGVAGAGLEFPLFRPSSFIIPRFGAGVGAAWLRVSRSSDSFVAASDGSPVLTPGGSDTVASPAGYVTAGLSMRVVGPMRLMVDGIFGTTLSRFVARDAGDQLAFWGQPLASLAFRAEVMVR